MGGPGLTNRPIHADLTAIVLCNVRVSHPINQLFPNGRLQILLSAVNGWRQHGKPVQFGTFTSQGKSVAGFTVTGSP
jgi:hypothetical protein